MKDILSDQKASQVRARSLLADLNGSPLIAIPRRDPIVAWLNAYLIRSDRRGFEAKPTDEEDMIAVDQHLRTYAVPLALESAA